MPLILNISFTFAAVLLFLFFFWQKLKEDYTRNQVFTTAFYTLFGVGAGNIIANFFAAPWWFYLGLVGGSLGILVGIFRFKLRIFETVEGGILGGLILILFAFLHDFTINKTVFSGIGSVVLILGIFLYFLLNKHYKHFTWYASGKVGFSGLVIAGGFFLIRSLVALKFLSVLSFVGSYETLISGVAAFVCFMLLFNLARKSPCKNRKKTQKYQKGKVAPLKT